MWTSWCGRLPRDVGVVVVAAGRGDRLGGTVPKQFQLIGGVPMVVRALRPFLAHPEVSHVVLVLPGAEASNPPAFLSDIPWRSGASRAACTGRPGGRDRGGSGGAGGSAGRAEC